MSAARNRRPPQTCRSPRTCRARVAASIALALLAACVFWVLPHASAIVAAEGTSSALGIPFIPIVSLFPKITLPPLDSATVVDIPDPSLSAALHSACGIGLATSLTRGNLIALAGDFDFSGKGIQDLEGIQYCKQIVQLEIGRNPIVHFPDLSGMTALQILWIDSCKLTEVPPEIQGCSNLSYLGISSNQITVLPEFLGTLPGLKHLWAVRNHIERIPENFATSRLVEVNLDGNWIVEIPGAVYADPTLTTLSLFYNRLKHVPTTGAGKAWDLLNLEFNFIDVSAGSKDLATLNALNASFKNWKRQFTPVRGLKATPALDSVKLQWTACTDFSDAAIGTVTVAKYHVYAEVGGVRTELATLGKGTTSYTDKNLAAGSPRTYVVGVEYASDTNFLVGPDFQYETLTTSTLAAATAAPSVTSAPTAEATPESGATATPSPAATPTAGAPAGGGGSGAVPGWMMALVVVLAVALAAAVVALVVVVRRGQGKKAD